MSGLTLAADGGWHVPRIPLGDWFEGFFDWVEEVAGEFFDGLNDFVNSITEGLTSTFTLLPPWGMFIVFALLAFWLSGWKLAVGSLIGFGVIDALNAFPEAMETLSLVLIAGVVALIIAIPLGILAARNDTASAIIRPVMDFMQTIPQFLYLIPAVVLFGIGTGAGAVATIAFALAPGVRLTELGIRQVDKEMVEAGEAFGSPPGKILRGIQIPLAMPSIMAGVNQVIMLSLSMVVIAGMVGAPGLGSEVFGAVTQLQLGPGFEYGLGVVILAIYLDRLTSALSGKSAVSRARKLAGTA